MRLAEAAGPIRAALERLAESPRELRCYIVIEAPVTRRFVQFCTPPPPSRFVGGPQLVGVGPLIFDGTGNGRPGGYERVQEFCDIGRGISFALDTLARYLPPEA
jgi:hypothetical protein